MSDIHQHGRERANPGAPVDTIVTYVPKPGNEAALLELVKRRACVAQGWSSDERTLSRLEGVRHPQTTRAVHRAVQLEGWRVERYCAPDTGGHGRLGADAPGTRRTDDLRSRAPLTSARGEELTALGARSDHD